MQSDLSEKALRDQYILNIHDGSKENFNTFNNTYKL